MKSVSEDHQKEKQQESCKNFTYKQKVTNCENEGQGVFLMI